MADWRGASFVRVTQNEFARLERRTRPGCRQFPAAFNDRLRQSIAIAKVVVRIDEWRHGLQVKRRQHFHIFALDNEFVVLRYASLALRFIAGEEDGDGMEIGAGQAADPVVWTIYSCVAKHLRTRDHPLPELLGKSGQ